jgi:ABC-type sulfate transport system substrate-binding protein
MKSLIQAVAVAVALIVPVASFAQSNAPLTRAQVRAQLVQLESVGYHPGDGDHTNYPQEIQAAEAKVAGQQAAVNDGYGGVASGSSDAGQSREVRVSSYSVPIYSHH